MKTNLMIVGIVAAIIVVAGAAYFVASPPSNSTSTKVTFQIGWKPFGGYAGWYVAQEKGFYEEVGLDVDIVPGSSNAYAGQMVGVGQADLGQTDSMTVISSRMQGVPIKSVAVIHSVNPMGYFTLDPEIRSPYDWEGKTIGANPTASEGVVFNLTVAKLGLDMSKITTVPMTFDIVQGVVEGLVDAAMGYTQNYISFEAAGYPNVYYESLQNYGINYYNYLMVASDTYIAEHPDTVRKFVAASIKGWEYTRDHVDEAADILVSLFPELNRSIEVQKIQWNVSNWMSWENPPLGHSTEAGWAEIQNTLIDLGFITGKLEAGPSDFFTEEFLP